MPGWCGHQRHGSPLSLVEEVCSKLAKATLVTIEGADHAFKVGKQDIIKVIASKTIDWMNNALEVENLCRRLVSCLHMRHSYSLTIIIG